MAVDENYLVPGALSTVARFQRRYPMLAKDRDPITIQETLIEATADIESLTSRRLAPFQNIIFEDMLNGINPNEYGDDSPGMPMSLQGSLGVSFANALGSDDLVRNFFIDQYAPLYSELWTYDIQSITLSLTYGNTQSVQLDAVYGPAANNGFMRLPLGTFAPEGTRIIIVYSGGYTLGIPPNLGRACLMQTAKLLTVDAVQAGHSTEGMAEHNDSVDRLIAPWMRY